MMLSTLFFIILRPLRSTLFPYTTLFRSFYIIYFYYRQYLKKEEQTSILIIMLDTSRTLLKTRGFEFQTRHLLIIAVLAIALDRKSTRLNSSHSQISYAVFCLKKKKKTS